MYIIWILSRSHQIHIDTFDFDIRQIWQIFYKKNLQQWWIPKNQTKMYSNLYFERDFIHAKWTDDFLSKFDRHDLSPIFLTILLLHNLKVIQKPIIHHLLIIHWYSRADQTLTYNRQMLIWFLATVNKMEVKQID